MRNPLRSRLFNGLRFYLRLLGIPILAVAVAFIAFNRADASDRLDTVSAGEVAAASRPVTHVLSARRVPVALVTPTYIARLAGPLAEIQRQLPASSSCLIVTTPALRVLYSSNPSTPLTPASNQKLLTAFTALTQFGPDKRFRTHLVTDAPIDRGIVAGDLYLIGGGDPVLSTADFAASFRTQPQVRTDFETLGSAIVAAGITRIRGTIVADGTRYDEKRVVDSWPSRFVTSSQNPVGPLSALNVNDGFVDYQRKDQELAGSGNHSPARNPPESAAETLIQILKNMGVTVDGKVVRSAKAPPTARVLAAVDSPPLTEIVHAMLRDSDNTTAELLLKEIGLARAANGSTAAGAAAMTSFLNEKALADPGLSIIDGSGLDAGNKVSCALLARILAVSGEISPVGSSLPVAAQNGTLADRFLGSPAGGRVRAKTGSLAEASSLSGWVDTVPGGNLVFAIITNTRNADDFKLLEEQFAAALLGYPDGPTPASVSPKPPILAAPR